MIVDEDVYLEHFGIKGMRWGVVNKDKGSGKETKQQKFERKAQKYDAKAKILQTRINEINVQIPKSRYFKRQSLVKERADLSVEKQIAQKAAQDKRQGKLTDKQRKTIKGAAIVTAIVAAVAAKQLVESGEMNRSIIKGKRYLNKSSGSIWRPNPKLARPDADVDFLMRNVVKDINPNYGAPGTKNNCRRATFAYEMRRRGHDVAATRTSNGYGQTTDGIYNTLSLKPGQEFVPTSNIGGQLHRLKESKKLAETGRMSPYGTAVSQLDSLGMKIKVDPGGKGFHQAIFNELAKQPNGARGELGVSWKIGGGHSVAWEIVKGKPVIFDTQSGKMFTKPDDLLKYGIEIKQAGITRLDNVKLNEDFLMRWLKNA